MFYGISTLVVYLIPNPIYIYKYILYRIYVTFVYQKKISSQNVTCSYACRNMVNTIMTNETQFFRKIYLSHFIRNGTKGLRKGYVWEVSWRLNKTATYWPPALLAIVALLSHPAGLLNRGPWFSLPWTATTDSKLWSPTNYLPVAPGYIIVCRPPASVSVAIASNSTRQQSRLSPDIFDWMHLLFTRVHFLFDSSSGLEVNMLQKGRKRKKNKKKNRKHKKYMWKIFTKDGIYCSYLKGICSSNEKYYKSQDEYLGK